jgi:hypothetical protein
MMKTTILLLILALAVACPATWAQMVFKSTRPDGSVVYSDAPLPGATVVERFQLVPLSPEDQARAKELREQEQRRTEEANERARKRELALTIADNEVKAALDAVKQAQQRLQDGVEPLPGERTGTGGGRSRLNSAYYTRMQQLEGDMSEAVKRLERAYTARNEVR